MRRRAVQAVAIPAASILLLAACTATTSPSASPSEPPASASAPPSVSSEPSVEASAPGSAAPSVPETNIDAYGWVGVVTGDNLRVRTWPGTSVPDSLLTTLSAGDQVVLANGPIDVDGFRWYVAWFEPHPFTNGGGMLEGGWVSTGPIDDEERFVDVLGPQCPGEMSVHALGRFQSAAYDACDVTLDTVSGIVETCYEGPISPFTYEPTWAHFSCLSLRTEEQAIWSYPFYLPPDYEGPELERGDVVTLTGDLGVDEARYGACRVTSSEVESEETVASVQAVWTHDCQYRFVVESVEVTGHVDLPPLF